MKYEIRLPAIFVDVVPLSQVCSTKAHVRATAGGTPFHGPMYDGSFKACVSDLLQEAKSGNLQVCDHGGRPGRVEDLIETAERNGMLVRVLRYLVEPDMDRLKRENESVAPGVRDFGHIDFGQSEIDWESTHIGALFATLKALNEWGATRGDEFTVTHEGVEWIDERGIMPERLVLEPTAGTTEQGSAGAAQAKPAEAPPLQHWKMRVQAEAAAEWRRLRAMNCNPTRASIRSHLVKWCKENNVKTDGGINPSDGYLRTHVLSGKHWKLPTD